MHRLDTTPGRLTILAAGVLLALMWGCSSRLAPMTRQLVDTKFPFDAKSNMLEEFDSYAKSPAHKVFAVALNPDGSVHAWAKS